MHYTRSNHTMQQMGASRFALLRSGSRWRLAPAADGERSEKQTHHAIGALWHDRSRTRGSAYNTPEGRALGDTTTLADPTVVQNPRETDEEKYGG